MTDDGRIPYDLRLPVTLIDDRGTRYVEGQEFSAPIGNQPKILPNGIYLGDDYVWGKWWIPQEADLHSSPHLLSLQFPKVDVTFDLPTPKPSDEWLPFWMPFMPSGLEEFRVMGIVGLKEAKEMESRGENEAALNRYRRTVASLEQFSETSGVNVQLADVWGSIERVCAKLGRKEEATDAGRKRAAYEK